MSIVLALLAAAAIVFLAALLWAARNENAALRAELDRTHEAALSDDPPEPSAPPAEVDNRARYLLEDDGTLTVNPNAAGTGETGTAQ